MVSIVLLVGIFVTIMALGIIFIIIRRRQMAKAVDTINVVAFIPTGGGIKWQAGTGSSKAVNTQKMLDVPFINRTFDYPSPFQMINNTAFYIQTDKVTYRPLVVRSPETLSKDLKQFKAQIEQSLNEQAVDESGQSMPKEYKINEQQMKNLFNYLSEPKLEPLTDPAYLLIYADNVERIVKDTAVEGDDIWSKIAKFMPAIMIVATAVALAIIFYAYIPLYNTVASALHSGLQITCNGATPTITNSTQVTTIKPPTI